MYFEELRARFRRARELGLLDIDPLGGRDQHVGGDRKEEN
jgi:hypothetical protein